MMRPLQAYSPSSGSNVVATTAKDSTVHGRSMANTNSPKWAKRGLSLPRVAGSLPPATSPAFRREPRVEANSNPIAKDGIVTPVKAFLSSNVTPRSGSRKARVDSASSTPNITPGGTPQTSRPNSAGDTEERSADMVTSMGIEFREPSGGPERRGGSVVSDGGSSSLSWRHSMDLQNYIAGTASSDSSPKFFHASDARPSASSRHTSKCSIAPVRTQSFRRANEGNYSENEGSALSFSPSLEEQRPKFFHANGAINSSSPPFRSPNGKAPNRPTLETIPSAQSISGQRSPSPLKEEFVPKPSLQRPTSPLKDTLLSRKSSLTKPSPRRHTRLVSNGAAGELKTPSPVALSYPHADSSRRSSLGMPVPGPSNPPPATQSELSRRSSLSTPSQRRFIHARSSSVNTPSSSPNPRRSVSLSRTNIPPPHYIKTSPTTLVPSLTPGPTLESPIITSQPQSPTTPPTSKTKLEQMNELAANARRERKVLDLEISNSSLLAINQALEREMRKQSVELRRFRRLSRTGRLSSARTASGKRSIPSGRQSDTHINHSDDDDFSDRSSAFDDDDPGDLSDFGSSPDTSPPPSSTFSPPPTTRTSLIPLSTHHQRPKPHSLLDLSRQRALLIDSQKLNQSLKRCLNRTEDLISDAKKALEYRVNVSDIENLGGRVLTPDDEVWGGRMGGLGLLSPGLGQGEMIGSPWEVGETEHEEALRGEKALQDSIMGDADDALD